MHAVWIKRSSLSLNLSHWLWHNVLSFKVSRSDMSHVHLGLVINSAVQIYTITVTINSHMWGLRLRLVWVCLVLDFVFATLVGFCLCLLFKGQLSLLVFPRSPQPCLCSLAVPPHRVSECSVAVLAQLGGPGTETVSGSVTTGQWG